MPAVLVHSNYSRDWKPNHEAVVGSRRPYAAYSKTRQLDSLGPGSIVWLVTGPTDPRLCARLVVATLEKHEPDAPTFNARYAAFQWKASADRELSEYCDPFECELVAALPWWRAQIKQPKVLDEAVAAQIQSIWDAARRQPVKDKRFL